MIETTLKVLLIIYILYSLLKFLGFFLRKDETKMKGLEMVYEKGEGRIIKIFDDVILVLMVVFVVLLFASGAEYLSFTTGLLVGMTIIQVYFHRFSDPLPKQMMPKPPLTALKLMSYSIQANPGKAWRELIFMTLLFIWALYMLLSRGL